MERLESLLPTIQAMVDLGHGMAKSASIVDTMSRQSEIEGLLGDFRIVRELSSFSLNSANGNPTDIVTDGQSVWTVDDTAKTDKVFKYSTAGSLLGSWTIDAANKAPTGIAIDPTNVSNIWIVDSGTDRVYQYNPAATRISGSQSAALFFALAAGNTNPQGIADPPALAESLLTSHRPTFAGFDVATLETSRESSLETKTKVRIAREQALAFYVPKLYDVPARRPSVTTKFEDGLEEMLSEFLAVENDAASDLALTADFAGVC
jgi:hypothetical protein